MKLKALLLALFTAGFAVSIAVAASPAAVDKDKRKPTVATATDGTTTGSTTGATTTGATTTSESKRGKDDEQEAERCKHGKKIVLSGDFVATGTGGFALKVTGGNKAGKAWKDKQATVLVDDKTKFKGKKRKLADLVAGDRVKVQGYACKADVAAGSLLARKVTSKGPKGAKHDDDDDDDSTTTSAP